MGLSAGSSSGAGLGPVTWDPSAHADCCALRTRGRRGAGAPTTEEGGRAVITWRGAGWPCRGQGRSPRGAAPCPACAQAAERPQRGQWQNACRWGPGEQQLAAAERTWGRCRVDSSVGDGDRGQREGPGRGQLGAAVLHGSPGPPEGRAGRRHPGASAPLHVDAQAPVSRGGRGDVRRVRVRGADRSASAGSRPFGVRAGVTALAAVMDGGGADVRLAVPRPSARRPPRRPHGGCGGASCAGREAAGPLRPVTEAPARTHGAAGREGSERVRVRSGG